jgi:hypothetical protein
MCVESGGGGGGEERRKERIKKSIRKLKFKLNGEGKKLPEREMKLK